MYRCALIQLVTKRGRRKGLTMSAFPREYDASRLPLVKSQRSTLVDERQQDSEVEDFKVKLTWCHPHLDD